MFNLSQIVNQKLNVQLEGKNPLSAEDSVKLSAIQDPDSGEFYLATVPVGHVAYDEFNDVFKVDMRKKSSLLKEYNYAGFITGGGFRAFGETETIYSSTPILPLDVSGFGERMVIITNTHDQSVLFSVYATKDLEGVQSGNLPLQNSHHALTSETISVPANSLYILDASKLSSINAPFVGLYLRFSRATVPTTGNINIQFYGR